MTRRESPTARGVCPFCELPIDPRWFGVSTSIGVKRCYCGRVADAGPNPDWKERNRDAR